MGTPVKPICRFSGAGCMGAECEQPAVEIGVFNSDRTKNGLYYTGRCAKHKHTRCLDNAGIIRFEPIADQQNEW